MAIIKEKNDEILGKLVCFSDEKLKYNYWGKYVTDPLWNREEMLLVIFDLYERNTNSYQSQLDRKTRKRKEQLWSVYQEWFRNGKRAEEILFEEFLNGFFFEKGYEKEEIEEYRRKYPTKEELFQASCIVEVRIHLNGYSVIVLVPWEEREVAIVNWKIFDPKERCGFLVWEEVRWLNEVTDEMLGELICFADEELQPVCWGKYEKCNLFHREKVLPIKFHLFFCNVNFASYYDEEKDTIKWKKRLWDVY